MKDVIIVENFLTEDECLYFRGITDACFKRSGLQIIVKRPDITEKFFNEHHEAFSKVILDGGRTKGLHDDVTFAKSTRAIPKHIDKNIREEDKWKLLIYLNDIKDGGGTIFYENSNDKEGFKVANKMGSAVFFNIALPHRGEALNGQLKYSIGFRLIT